MSDILNPELPLSEPDDGLNLANYAQRAYLEYALSVVKGRALPDVCDGQKPVQRRILYSMDRMGLGFSGPNNNTAARPVKSARVVGDVLGRFHPHGDQAAYDALVRMAQDFAQRYPLIDGQGNFGSRDGDGAAAMRYTEARLAKITTLLLDEIDEGTVDFVPNYDGSTVEPKQLPARLPFNLLNGASGIAVGLATEIPSHNLREVADACVALIKSPKLTDDELFAILPGPDYPGGGQIISPAGDIVDAYRTGRGSLKVRARWKIEDLARGQWQLVVTELPPGVSTQRVLEEIEELTNPKVKTGKKALTQEQTQLKASILMVLDGVRDESSKDAPVRLLFEPKSSRIGQQELITALLAHTSLESSTPINLTMIGIDGRPTQKSLRQMLNEWIEFRQSTITRRSQHRLTKVLDRIHILEGRQLVLLNIDEVIAIIRQADDPKAALIERFRLSDRQAEDILEIRLRQLARLEAIKIEQELKSLKEEQGKLEDILGNPGSLKRLMVKEIEADAKTFADARRTLIGRAGDGGGVQQRLGARTHRPWPRGRQLRVQGGRRPVWHVRMPHGGHHDRVRQQRTCVQRAGGQPARCAWRWPAHHHADRAGDRHAAAALLRRPGECRAAVEQHGWLRLPGHGGEHGLAPARRQDLPEPRRRRNALRAVARRVHVGRPTAERSHPRVLRLHGRSHPHFRDRRTQADGEGRPWPDADRPGAQGHAGRCGGLHPQREDRRHRSRRQGTRRNAGDPQPEQRPCRARPQRQSRRPGLQAQSRDTGGMNMDNSELTGVVIAAALAVLAFGVTRFAVRHFARRRAAKDQVAEQATQSRQVRRASERRKR